MNENIIDNELVKKNIIYEDNLSRVERLSSMLLDHFIVCMATIPIIIIPFAITMETNNKLLEDIFLYSIFGIYLNKDFLKGRSLAKRILGQIVLDLKTNEPASELQCTIRNFTIIFWIVEVIIVFFNPNRRIGDLIIGTKVVRAKKQSLKTILIDLKKANKINSILSLGLAISYIWIVFQFAEGKLIYLL